jgi:hypothetical protein
MAMIPEGSGGQQTPTYFGANVGVGYNPDDERYRTMLARIDGYKRRTAQATIQKSFQYISPVVDISQRINALGGDNVFSSRVSRITNYWRYSTGIGPDAVSGLILDLALSNATMRQVRKTFYHISEHWGLIPGANIGLENDVLKEYIKRGMILPNSSTHGKMVERDLATYDIKREAWPVVNGKPVPPSVAPKGANSPIPQPFVSADRIKPSFDSIISQFAKQLRNKLFVNLSLLNMPSHINTLSRDSLQAKVEQINAAYNAIYRENLKRFPDRQFAVFNSTGDTYKDGLHHYFLREVETRKFYGKGSVSKHETVLAYDYSPPLWVSAADEFENIVYNKDAARREEQRLKMEMQGKDDIVQQMSFAMHQDNVEAARNYMFPTRITHPADEAGVWHDPAEEYFEFMKAATTGIDSPFLEKSAIKVLEGQTLVPGLDIIPGSKEVWKLADAMYLEMASQQSMALMMEPFEKIGEGFSFLGKSLEIVPRAVWDYTLGAVHEYHYEHSVGYRNAYNAIAPKVKFVAEPFGAAIAFPIKEGGKFLIQTVPEAINTGLNYGAMALWESGRYLYNSAGTDISALQAAMAYRESIRSDPEISPWMKRSLQASLDVQSGKMGYIDYMKARTRDLKVFNYSPTASILESQGIDPHDHPALTVTMDMIYQTGAIVAVGAGLGSFARATGLVSSVNKVTGARRVGYANKLGRLIVKSMPGADNLADWIARVSEPWRIRRMLGPTVSQDTVLKLASANTKDDVIKVLVDNLEDGAFIDPYSTAIRRRVWELASRTNAYHVLPRALRLGFDTISESVMFRLDGENFFYDMRSLGHVTNHPPKRMEYWLNEACKATSQEARESVAIAFIKEIAQRNPKRWAKLEKLGKMPVTRSELGESGSRQFVVKQWGNPQDIGMFNPEDAALYAEQRLELLNELAGARGLKLDEVRAVTLDELRAPTLYNAKQVHTDIMTTFKLKPQSRTAGTDFVSQVRMQYEGFPQGTQERAIYEAVKDLTPDEISTNSAYNLSKLIAKKVETRSAQAQELYMSRFGVGSTEELSIPNQIILASKEREILAKQIESFVTPSEAEVNARVQAILQADKSDELRTFIIESGGLDPIEVEKFEVGYARAQIAGVTTPREHKLAGWSKKGGLSPTQLASLIKADARFSGSGVVDERTLLDFIDNYMSKNKRKNYYAQLEFRRLAEAKMGTEEYDEMIETLRAYDSVLSDPQLVTVLSQHFGPDDIKAVVSTVTKRGRKGAKEIRLATEVQEAELKAAVQEEYVSQLDIDVLKKRIEFLKNLRQDDRILLANIKKLEEDIIKLRSGTEPVRQMATYLYQQRQYISLPAPVGVIAAEYAAEGGLKEVLAWAAAGAGGGAAYSFMANDEEDLIQNMITGTILGGVFLGGSGYLMKALDRMGRASIAGTTLSIDRLTVWWKRYLLANPGILMRIITDEPLRMLSQGFDPLAVVASVWGKDKYAAELRKDAEHIKMWGSYKFERAYGNPAQFYSDMSPETNLRYIFADMHPVDHIMIRPGDPQYIKAATITLSHIRNDIATRAYLGLTYPGKYGREGLNQLINENAAVRQFIATRGPGGFEYQKKIWMDTIEEATESLINYAIRPLDDIEKAQYNAFLREVAEYDRQMAEGVWYRAGEHNEYTEFCTPIGDEIVPRMTGSRDTGVATGQYSFSSPGEGRIPVKKAKNPLVIGKEDSYFERDYLHADGRRMILKNPEKYDEETIARATSYSPWAFQEDAINLLRAAEYIRRRFARGQGEDIAIYATSTIIKVLNSSKLSEGHAGLILRGVENFDDTAWSLAQLRPANISEEQAIREVYDVVRIWAQSGSQVHPMNILLHKKWGFDGITYSGKASWAADDATFGNVRFPQIDERGFVERRITPTTPGYKQIGNRYIDTDEEPIGPRPEFMKSNVPKDFTPTIKNKRGTSYYTTMLPEGKYNLYHVTTAKSKVLEEGLKSDSQLIAEGRTFAGLEGGNIVTGQISVGINEADALQRADVIRTAVLAARGEISADELMAKFWEWVKGSRLYKDESDVYSSILRELPLYNIKYDEFAAAYANPDSRIISGLVGEWCDTPEAQQQIRQLLNAMAETEAGQAKLVSLVTKMDYNNPRGSVVLHSSPESLRSINPDEIAILRVAVKRGAIPTISSVERELRYEPGEVIPYIAEPFLEEGQSINYGYLTIKNTIVEQMLKGTLGITKENIAKIPDHMKPIVFGRRPSSRKITREWNQYLEEKAEYDLQVKLNPSYADTHPAPKMPDRVVKRRYSPLSPIDSLYEMFEAATTNIRTSMYSKYYLDAEKTLIQTYEARGIPLNQTIAYRISRKADAIAREKLNRSAYTGRRTALEYSLRNTIPFAPAMRDFLTFWISESFRRPSRGLAWINAVQNLPDRVTLDLDEQYMNAVGDALANFAEENADNPISLLSSLMGGISHSLAGQRITFPLRQLSFFTGGTSPMPANPEDIEELGISFFRQIFPGWGPHVTFPVDWFIESFPEYNQYARWIGWTKNTLEKIPGLELAGKDIPLNSRIEKMVYFGTALVIGTLTSSANWIATGEWSDGIWDGISLPGPFGSSRLKDTRNRALDGLIRAHADALGLDITKQEDREKLLSTLRQNYTVTQFMAALAGNLQPMNILIRDIEASDLMKATNDYSGILLRQAPIETLPTDELGNPIPDRIKGSRVWPASQARTNAYRTKQLKMIREEYPEYSAYFDALDAFYEHDEMKFAEIMMLNPEVSGFFIAINANMVNAGTKTTMQLMGIDPDSDEGMMYALINDFFKPIEGQDYLDMMAQKIAKYRGFVKYQQLWQAFENETSHLNKRSLEYAKLAEDFMNMLDSRMMKSTESGSLKLVDGEANYGWGMVSKNNEYAAGMPQDLWKSFPTQFPSWTKQEKAYAEKAKARLEAEAAKVKSSFQQDVVGLDEKSWTYKFLKARMDSELERLGINLKPELKTDRQLDIEEVQEWLSKDILVWTDTDAKSRGYNLNESDWIQIQQLAQLRDRTLKELAFVGENSIYATTEDGPKPQVAAIRDRYLAQLNAILVSNDTVRDMYYDWSLKQRYERLRDMEELSTPTWNEWFYHLDRFKEFMEIYTKGFWRKNSKGKVVWTQVVQGIFPREPYKDYISGKAKYTGSQTVQPGAMILRKVYDELCARDPEFAKDMEYFSPTMWDYYLHW